MMRPRLITQPGRPPAERAVVVPCKAGVFRFTLAPGRKLIDAVSEGFLERGYTGGTVKLDGLAMGPFGYVMPALSKDGRHAAFYSEPFQLTGTTRIVGGAMTVGVRDNAPFFHAHAIWDEPGGKRSGGHILPEETVVAEKITLEACGLVGAMFQSEPDVETGFTLFSPQACRRGPASAAFDALAVRLRPNQDFAGALEGICRDHGLSGGIIRGGVGSTIGAAFARGPVVPHFATEVYLSRGVVDRGAGGALQATLEAGLVDYTGRVATGELLRGDNPVLMTFELVITAA